MLFITLVMSHVSFLEFSLIHFSLSYILNVLETLLILGRVKNLIKLLLDFAALLQGPVAVLLVAEDDVVEDGSRHPEQVEHLRVDIRTLAAHGGLLPVGESGGDDALQCLGRDILDLLGGLHGSTTDFKGVITMLLYNAIHSPGDDLVLTSLAGVDRECQLDLTLDTRLLRHLRVVYEGFPSTASRWTISGTHILQALCNTRSGNTEKEERDKVTEYLPMMVVFPHPF